MTDLWGALLDPLADETRPEFEREFPEIPTPDLCQLAIMFRIARRERRAPVGEIKAEVEALEGAVSALLKRLDELSFDASEAIANLTRGQALGQRIKLLKQLRSYRSALWEADNRLEPARGAGRGELPRLVAAMSRLFERNGVPVEASEGGRFVRAIDIALAGAGDRRTTAKQIKSLAGSVAYALKQNKGARAA